MHIAVIPLFQILRTKSINYKNLYIYTFSVMLFMLIMFSILLF